VVYGYLRPILKISQAKGLRDPKCGRSLSSLALLRRLGMSVESSGTLTKNDLGELGDVENGGGRWCTSVGI
jgi:hypothetical protein